MSAIRLLDVLKANWNGSRRLAMACALIIAMATVSLHAQTIRDLYDFNCGTSSTGGCNPYQLGSLTRGADGNLYGPVSNAGPTGNGSVVSLSTSGTYTDMADFDPTTGTGPSSLTLASDGNFYGTTNYGGAYGYGTVFRFTPPKGPPPGVIAVLHNFSATEGREGIEEGAPPIQAQDGNLYGVTGLGATYRITLPAGVYQQLQPPNTVKGVSNGFLYLASDGKMYGTTYGNDTDNGGSVFSMHTSGVVYPVYNFAYDDTVNGYNPLGPLTQGRDGQLYGTTLGADGGNAGGTVFKLAVKPKIKLTTLYTFPSSVYSDGTYPIGLTAASDGSLYGVTLQGGAFSDGSLFQITSSGSFNEVYDFNDGSRFGNSLMQNTDGSFYGLRESGGVYSGGYFYSLTPPNPLLSILVEGPIFVKPGVPVTILGDNLNQVINVAFAGVQAQFQPGSNTYLLAEVPSDAIDGFVTVTFETGEQIQSQSAMHILPLIANLDPSSGPVGTQVTIVGGGFIGATKVMFGGVKATNFRVVTPSLIQAIVPTGAKTGSVAVTTPNGAATSKQKFTVY